MNEKRLVLLVLALVVLVSFLDSSLIHSFGGVTWWGYDEFVRIKDAAVNLMGIGEGDGSPPLQAVQKGELKGSLAPGQVLKASLSMGEIHLSGVKEGQESQAGTARLQYEVRVYGQSKEAAQEHADQIKVALQPLAGGGLELVVNEPPRPNELRVKVVVQGTLPATCRVDLQNGYGPVKVSDLSGPSVVRNEYGPTELGRLVGDWTVEADYSVLLVDGVGGNLEVRGDFGGADLRHVGGKLTIRSDYKDMQVADVRGDMDVRGDYGSLGFEDVGGSVTLDVNYKDVDGDGVGGDLAANSAYGDLRFTGLRRNVEIETRFADVSLEFAEPLNHRFDLRSRYGSINDGLGVSKVRPAGRFEEAREGVAGQGRYRVTVSTEYGHIRLR